MAGDWRAPSRRRILAAGVISTVIAASGCLGDDGGDEGGDGGGGGGGGGGDGGGDGGETTGSTPTETTAETTTGTATETPGATPTGTPTTTDEGGTAATGEVTVDGIEELEIVDWTSKALSEEGIFQVEVTLGNAGEKDVRITPGRHRVEVTLYDRDGSELADTYGAVLEDTDLPAGETAQVKANAELDDPSRVASYEIRLVCGETGFGEYCG